MIPAMRPLLLVTLLPLTVGAQDVRTRALAGTWTGSDRPPAVAAGAMTLRRTTGRWQLNTSGGPGEAPVQAGDQVIEVRGAGTLRFGVRRGQPAGRALWVQPPGPMGHGFATPVTLQRQRDGSWHGVIRPLAAAMTLRMRIWPRADGALLARIRNPEFGWNLGRTFVAVPTDSTIELRDPATGAVRFTQPYRPARGEIEFDFGRPVVLVRRPDPEAPRVPRGVPPRGADGWQVGRPGQVGFDTTRLHRVLDALVTADPFGDSTLLIHSLHVVRRQRLVVEYHATDMRDDGLHDTRSAFKTFVGIMAGAAMQDDAPLTADTRVHEVLGPAWPPGDRRREITLGHLLTHASGLACDDNDARSPGNEEVMQRQQQQPDWAAYLLAPELVHPPGTHYAYCSGGIHLAAAMVARTTREWLPSFFERAVARPLDMDHYALNLAPNGDGYGGGGAYLAPRDLLKVGQLVISRGAWRGRQVVSRAWMGASVAHQVATPDGGSDGFAWHRFPVRAAGRVWQEVEANGNGGQMVMVVPELDLVVGVTAGNYNGYGTWRRLRGELLPAIIESIARP